VTVTRFVCGSTHTEVFVASGRLPFVTGVPPSGRQSLVAADPSVAVDLSVVADLSVAVDPSVAVDLSVAKDHGKRANIGRLGHERLRPVVLILLVRHPAATVAVATQYPAAVDKPVIRDLILGEGGALPLADDLATERAFAHRLLLEQCLDFCDADVFIVSYYINIVN